MVEQAGIYMKGFEGWLLKLLYLALACAMFYFVTEDIVIGGFGFMYRYLFGMAIIAMAFLVFLIRPKTERLLGTIKYCCVLSTPYLWTMLYSLVIWVLSFAQFRVMTRGFFFIVYQLIGILTAGATLYLFGKNGVFMMLGSVLLANTIYLIQAFADYGIAAVLLEYKDLVLSLASQTGSIMKSFELKGYSYILGFFLLFFILNMRQSREKIWLLPITVFFFLMGMKRSVIMSLVVSLAVGMLLMFVREKTAKKIVLTLGWFGIFFGLIYVIACYYGLFEWLESIGIDTNARADAFNQFQEYYEISPGYLGHGAGFVNSMMSQGEIVLESEGYKLGDLHNDFLRQYVELGFVGYIVWMWLFLNYRSKFFFQKIEKKTDIRHGIWAFCFIVANYTMFMTENALYFFYPTMAVALLIMAYRYEEYCDIQT